PLDGRRIMFHAEQGFGDTFQFVRYARLVTFTDDENDNLPGMIARSARSVWKRGAARANCRC
ncbi:MAG: hypothetical protein B7Z73_13280, partial [Planctomycetia bacterium 21-64-5]